MDAGTAENLGLFVIYSSSNDRHCEMESGNVLTLFEDSVRFFREVQEPISSGMDSSLFLYKCNFRARHTSPRRQRYLTNLVISEIQQLELRTGCELRRYSF